CCCRPTPDDCALSTAPVDGLACASAVRRRLHRRFALFPIAPLLPPLPRLKIVDVGAMSLGEGTLPYADLVKATPCDVIGFEPLQAEFDKLSRQEGKAERFLPYFVGDGSKATFRECNFAMTSSLFEPNT